MVRICRAGSNSASDASKHIDIEEMNHIVPAVVCINCVQGDGL